MYNIIKTSRVLKRVFSFLVIIPSLLTLVLWVCTSHLGIGLYAKLFGYLNLSNVFIKNDLFVTMTFPIFILFVVIFAIQTYWFWQLKQLFGFYSEGRTFTSKNSAYLYRAALSFMMIAFFQMLINGLPSTYLTANNSEGHVLLNIIFAILQVCNILMGFVLLVVAQIMEEGQRLKEEIDFTI